MVIRPSGWEIASQSTFRDFLILTFFKPASSFRAILEKGGQYAFGRQIETSGGDGIHFALASRDPNSDSAHYFPAAGLHIISEAGKARGG
jgi:hypothetical protein